MAWWRPPGNGCRPLAETGADGRYSIRVGAGLYGSIRGTHRDREVVIVKEEETITKDFHLDRLDAS